MSDRLEIHVDGPLPKTQRLKSIVSNVPRGRVTSIHVLNTGADGRRDWFALDEMGEEVTVGWFLQYSDRVPNGILTGQSWTKVKYVYDKD